MTSNVTDTLFALDHNSRNQRERPYQFSLSRSAMAGKEFIAGVSTWPILTPEERSQIPGQKAGE